MDNTNTSHRQPGCSVEVRIVPSPVSSQGFASTVALRISPMPHPASNLWSVCGHTLVANLTS
eukprot:667615-Prorocentrum_minimum.AAC.5